MRLEDGNTHANSTAVYVLAHLTIVFTALAINRYLYQATGVTLTKIVRTLKPLQDITITLAGHHITAHPQLTPHATTILTNLHNHKGH